MNSEEEVKKLFQLRSDYNSLGVNNTYLEIAQEQIAEYENTLKNPKPFELENGKPTNKAKKLEEEFREDKEGKYETESISDILSGLFRHPFIKAGIIIGLFIIGCIIAEIFLQKAIAADPASEAMLNEKGPKILVIVFFSLIGAVNIIPVLFNLIKKIVYSIKIRAMKFSKSELQELEEAKISDAKNEEYNKKLIEKEKPIYERNQEKYLKDLKVEINQRKKEIEEYKKEIEKYAKKIEENDCLGQNEKSKEIVEMLAYFIESKRADSVKEALHEYDKIKFNAAQLAIEEQKVNLEREKMESEQRDRMMKLEQERMHQIQVESQMAQQKAAMDNMGREIWLSNKK